MRTTVTLFAVVVGATGHLAAQAVSRAPAGPPRPIAVARTPSAAPATTGQPVSSGERPGGERPANGERPSAERPARDSGAARPIIVEGGYNPAYLTNYGYTPASGPAMYVQQAPPPSPPEVVGIAPRASMAWIPGFHQWNGAGFFWTQGRWVDIPPPYTRWVAGRWASSQLGHYWVPGYWATGN